MSTAPATHAVGLGEVLWDLLPAGKQLGGAPANFAFHAAQLGAAGHVASAVGDDALGREILDRLDALGLNRACVAVDPDHPTGVVDVTLDGAGVPAYVIRKGVAWDFVPDTPALRALAARTNVVCYGTLAQRSPASRVTIRQFIEATPPDALRIFDVNLRQRYYDADVIRRTLAVSSVVKLNDAEVDVVAELAGLRSRGAGALEELVRRYPIRLAALTRGAAGSVLATRERTSDHGGFATDVVDTDAFTAALATGLLAGRDLDAINASANRLAAYVCTQAGATPVLPDDVRREVLNA